jgi:two-component system, cell cycle response regulator DivK
MSQTVLIVDDNRDLRQILASLLRFSGYEIIEASTGSEAVKAAISEKPNLILLDLELPDIAGSDVARMIKNNAATEAIPIIGCSAFLGAEYRDGALRAGMADYLLKPISLAAIKNKIQEYMLTDR